MGFQMKVEAQHCIWNILNLSCVKSFQVIDFSVKRKNVFSSHNFGRLIKCLPHVDHCPRCLASYVLNYIFISQMYL